MKRLHYRFAGTLTEVGIFWVRAAGASD